MNCPRDHAVLCSFKKGSLEVNQCDVCNGFSVLLTQAAAEAMEKQLNGPISRTGEGDGVMTLVSPYTGETMKRFLYRGLPLDYCAATHSVWFDQGEYARMFQAPTKKSSSKLITAGDATSQAWEFVDDAGTTFEVLGFVGEVVVELLSEGADLFS